MSRSPDSTLPSRRIPSVVLIAAEPEVFSALKRAVRHLDDAPRVTTAGLKDAATVVADWRPFAVIVPADVLAFDPAEFRALARDVGAEVVTYDAEAGANDAAARLLPELKAMHRRWAASEFAQN